MTRTREPVPRADARRILDSVRLLVRELRASAAAAELATGLSGAQLFVLRALAREPGLGVNDLAARTLTHQSSVSAVVGKLEVAGLVERRRSPDDARRVALHPTAEGRDLAAHGPDPVQERLVAGLERLSASTRRRLAADLARWTTAIGVYEAEPEMFFEPARRD